MKTQVLIICTSQGSNEYSQYWKQNNTEYSLNNQLFIIQGYNNNANGITTVEAKIDSFQSMSVDIYFLWHGASFQRSKQGKTKNGTDYTCFYYSTTDQGLNDFWSYRSGENWQIPQIRPQKPLDSLCWAINQKPNNKPEQVTIAIKGVIDYFKKKDAKNAKLNTALEFLHGCLGDYTNIPHLPIEFQKCQEQYNIFQGARNNQNLRILRDEMLKEAGVIGEN